MSEAEVARGASDNVQLARDGYEAMARGDVDAIRELLHPDVKWHGGDPSAIDACHNRDQALAFMMAARERRSQAGRFLGELVDVIGLGEQVVLVIRPGDVDHLRANLVTFRDGKVIEMMACESTDAALAAATSRAGS